MDVVGMLKQLKELGLSDTRIARELGMCPSSIHKIRRGRIKNPRHSTVRSIELLYQIIFSQRSPITAVNLPVPVLVPVKEEKINP